LAAIQKIGDGCHHLCAAPRAGTNCQDQIPERKPRARSYDLAKLAISLHMLAVSPLSRCDASGGCDYVIHGCASSYLPFVHFRTDHWATLLFNFKTPAFASAMVWPSIESTAKSAPRYVRKRGFINRRAKIYKAANIAITTRMPFDC
jgi:hypothetical protein